MLEEIDTIDKTNSTNSTNNNFNHSIKQDISKNIKIIKRKSKEGYILRMNNDYTAIVKELFKKDSKISDFIGKKIIIDPIFDSENNALVSKVEGTIVSEIGQSGKVKVDFNTNIKQLKVQRTNGDVLDWKDFRLILKYSKPVKLF